jgi:hypothetical protein
MREWMQIPTYSKMREHMWVTNGRFTPTPPPMSARPVPIRWAGWAQESLWALRKGEKSLVSTGNRTTIFQ